MELRKSGFVEEYVEEIEVFVSSLGYVALYLRG